MTNYSKLSAGNNSAGDDGIKLSAERIRELMSENNLDCLDDKASIQIASFARDVERAAVELDRQSAMPAADWLDGFHGLVNQYKEAQLGGSLIERVKARRTIHDHARRRIAPAAQQDANTGHGHVFPRPDGMKMKCGGPGLCQECANDAARKARQDASVAQAVPKREPVAIVTTDDWGSPQGFVYTGAIFKLRAGKHNLYTEPPETSEKVAAAIRNAALEEMVLAILNQHRCMTASECIDLIRALKTDQQEQKP